MTAPFRGKIIGKESMPTPEMQAWIQEVSDIANAARSATTTANRPTRKLWVGRMHFDTTLGQPVWYDGSGWVDATGASV